VGKLPFYIGKTIQIAGLLLILLAWAGSLAQGGSMNFLFKFTVAGMTVFMIGWVVQKYL
jgi:hypothetical protein